jgi:hypothetical protein
MDAPSTNLLHDRDLAAWAERQAEVLRRLGRSRGEEWPELDWVNLAEEMESLGRTEVKLVTSPLKLLFVQILEAVSDPSATSMPHRKTEAVGWLDDAAEDFTPSMRRKIDLDRLWRSARKRAAASLAEHGRRLRPGLPDGCAFALDELLDEAFSFEQACQHVTRLSGEAGSPER